MSEIHIGKQILPIVSAVTNAIQGGKEWFLDLPHIQFLLKIPVFKDLIMSIGNIGSTVTEVGQVFCETVYGINLARNSRVYQQNLAGRGQSLLANLQPSSRHKSLYEAAVLAHNESLNLPEISRIITTIEGEVTEVSENPIEIMNQWRTEAIQRVTEFSSQLEAKVLELKGNARRSARVQIKRATDAIAAMQTKKIPQIFANTNPDYDINSRLKWQLNSISTSARYDINSIRQSNIYASAIAPIAVGGAATLVGAGAIIGSIASWLLTNVFLKAVVGFPMQLLDALKHTVTSIVLKVLGSSGADAYRFLAASVIKAGKNLIPVIFARTGMFTAAWTFLAPYALPIMLTAIIIITSMRNKVLLGENLYVYGKTSETMFSLTTAHLYNTSRMEMQNYMQELAVSLKAESGGDFEKFYGVAADDDDVPVMLLDFKENVENPMLIIGDEAIVAFLGGDFATIVKTYTLF